MKDLYIYNFVKKFKCLGDKCSDNCCTVDAWDITVDSKTILKYEREAPMLLDYVEKTPQGCYMAFSHEKNCVAFEKGICKIHRDYGESFLNDMCYTYPKVIREYSNKSILTAGASCPEIARIVLYEENSFLLEKIPARERSYIKDPIGVDYSDISNDELEKIHELFFNFVKNTQISNEEKIFHLLNMSSALNKIPHNKWFIATEFFINTYHQRIPNIHKDDKDPYYLISIIASIYKSKQETKRQDSHFFIIFNHVASELNISINWDEAEIIFHDDTISRFIRIKNKWDEFAKNNFDKVLLNYILGQMACTIFPYWGIAKNIQNNAFLIGVNYLIVKLCLMCHVEEDGNLPNEQLVIKIVQTISRFVDHYKRLEWIDAILARSNWFQDERFAGLLKALGLK